jgi:RNA polymerase sigma factor (sigma-70 family)
MSISAPPSAEALIVENRALVYHFASRYAGIARARNIDLDDLAGEGMVALCHAASEYRPDAGTKFSTFASRVILQALWRALNAGRYRWRPGQLPVNEDGRELDPPDNRHGPEPGTALDAEAVLHWLEPRDRKLLEMSYLHGLTNEEISGQLGISQQRVGQLLGRALRRARLLAGQGKGTASVPAATVCPASSAATCSR